MYPDPGGIAVIYQGELMKVKLTEIAFVALEVAVIVVIITAAVVLWRLS